MFLDRLDNVTDKIVICIPIALDNKKAIAHALADKYGMNYLLAGGIFQDTIAKEYCLIDIRERQQANNVDVVNVRSRDPIDSFNLLGEDKISEETLEEIKNYRQAVYLISYDVGYKACVTMARFTQIFLSIGGIAVMVDSTGIVCDRDRWLASCNSQDVFDIYSLFVTLTAGEDFYCSCGMNNFGKADVSIDISEDMGLAIYVMNVFNYYRLTESVIIRDGQTFQPDIECPMYEIQWCKFREVEMDDLLDKSNGRWHLSCFNHDLDISYRVS